jgi:hypothetical protein
VEACRQDLVFRPETRKDGNARQGQCPDNVHPIRYPHVVFQSAHIAHILRVEIMQILPPGLGRLAELSIMFHVMVPVFDAQDDRTRAQEEQRLEEGMHHQVEHPGPECAHANCGNHESKLADGRVCQDFLDIELRHSDCRSK